LCERSIFTERFARNAGSVGATNDKMDSIVHHYSTVHHLGLVLGGRPAAGFAERLMLQVSADISSQFRVVRNRDCSDGAG
jgi:hypothetical protein